LYQVIDVRDKEEYVDSFLAFPKELYEGDCYTQNVKDEMELLAGNHILSHYFTIYPYLVIDDNGKTVGRCALTTYEEDDVAYLGFFECINDSICAGLLLQTAKKKALSLGKTRIIGPVDASFWIKYRFKNNCFDGTTYFGEPYNKQYYVNLFEENNFSITKRYYSNESKRVSKRAFCTPKAKQRYKKFKTDNYEFRRAKKVDYDTLIAQVYQLLTSLYKGFPIFKPILEAEYITLFSNLKYALDYRSSMVVYKDSKPVGFSITLPDYEDLLYKQESFKNKWKLLRRTIHARRYVVLYIGAEKGHYGLGMAMTRKIAKSIWIRRSGMIGGLMLENKVTNIYGKGFVDNQYEYVLMECAL